jgi:hypothetical protein
MKRNITLSLEKDLITKARVLSARRMVSVSKLLGDEVTRIIEEEEKYEESRQIAISLLKKGYHLGSKSIADREALHER